MEEKQEKKPKRIELDHVITLIRVLIAANLKESDQLRRIGIKHQLTTLKNAVLKLYNSEVSDKKEDIDERQRVVFEEIKKDVDEYVKAEESNGRQVENRDALEESLKQDHPTLIELNREWKEFIGSPVEGEVPTQIFSSFERPEGDAKVSINGMDWSYDTGEAYDYLLKKGFIVIVNNKKEKKDVKNSK